MGVREMGGQSATEHESKKREKVERIIAACKNWNK